MKKKILNICLQTAKQNNDKHPQWDCYHHFTFIIQKNTIIDWGTNRSCNALIHLGYPPHTKMHSEVDAFNKAKGIMERNKPFEIVNVRITKTGTIRQSSPCKCCFNFLRNLGCRKAWFTTEIGEFASIILNE